MPWISTPARPAQACTVQVQSEEVFLVPGGRIVVGWCGDVDRSEPAWSRMAAEITAAEYEVWRIQVA